VTDVAARNGTENTIVNGGQPASDDTQVLDAGAGAPADVQWAPAEPSRPRRHLGLWIGIPVGVALLGAAAASFVLIAPGTTVAGVPVGFLTQGAAADVIAARLADTEVVIAGEDAAVTGADLGASIDADAAAQAAFADRPMWNVTQWFGEPVDAPVTVDADAAVVALETAAPDMYTAPVDAALAFDAATQSYTVTPAVDGEGIDVPTVQNALEDAFASGSATTEIEPVLSPVSAHTTTEEAQGAADLLNGMMEKIGFYVGEERTVAVDRATAASWITLTTDADGAFVFDVDATQIQSVVDTLPGLVNRAAVNATAITNSAGEMLQDVQGGQTGRELGATDTVAADFAEQLTAGDAVYQLPVTETAFTTTNLVRTIDVDLSDQRVYLKENGAVVDSWLVSTGVSNTPTFTGNYTIGSKYTSQTMNGYNRDAAGNITGTYSTPNVKWAAYFNGGQAFHGVYWHNNYGSRMSHGCVGMPEWRAQQLYNWAPKGVEVSIHN
jgi:lipoprotein-anchoring transpeptidase ErfK/SrfK